MSLSIKGTIRAKNVIIHPGATLDESAVICGPDGNEAEEVVLGAHSFIGPNVKIMVPTFRMGDYSKLHSFSFARGEKPMQIGRNCWIGGNCVLDSLGGLDIDDGVGIGAHSQIWTHIRFGDIVEGCRFNSSTYMHIGKDAWFVGHCIVSPIKVEEKAMALVGSVITKDMKANHIYGGSPAKDLTDKIGPQFENRTSSEKAKVLQNLIDEFEIENPKFAGMLKIVYSESEMLKNTEKTYFNISNRTYTKKLNDAEVAFMKKNVPLIKFIPHDELEFIVR